MEYKELLELIDALENGPTLEGLTREGLTREVAAYLFAVGLSEDAEPTEAFLEVAGILVDRMDYEELLEEPELVAVQATIKALHNLGYIGLEEF